MKFICGLSIIFIALALNAHADRLAPTTIVGSWEEVSASKTPDHYIISDHTMLQISYDENQLYSRKISTFEVEGNELVLDVPIYAKEQRLRVKTLTPTNLTLIPMEDGVDQPTIQLRRISAEAAVPAFKPVPQTLAIHIKAGNLDSKSELANNFRDGQKDDVDGPASQCIYHPNQPLNFELMGFTQALKNGHWVMLESNPKLYFSTRIDFDWTRNTQEADTSFIGLLNHGAADARGYYATEHFFKVSQDGACSMHVSRKNHEIDYAATCSGLYLFDPNMKIISDKATLDFQGHCALTFLD